MKKFLTLLLLIPCIASGQIISRSAITSFSSFYNAGGLTVAATAGEPLVATLSDASGGILLAQGYQQPQELPCASINPTIVANAWNCINGYSLTLYAPGLPVNSNILWSNGANSNTIKFLTAGIYTATITTAPGCTLTTSYNLQTPVPFKTYQQGNWGANTPLSGPASIFLYNNFSTAFPAPEYLTIGCTRKLRLTTAQAVNDFLPSSGTSKTLPSGTSTNPGASISNTLAGQVVALTLNTKFDQLFSSFAPADENLASLVVTSGAFAGKTVQFVLNEANRKLGSCSSPYTLSALNNICTQINQNYQNGTTNSGLLACSTNPAANPPARLSENNLDGDLIIYPNPTSGNFNIAYSSEPGNALQIQVMDLSGKALYSELKTMETGSLTMTLSASDLNMSSGIYFVTIKSDRGTIAQKLVISE